MCGIIAVVRRRSTREPVSVDAIIDELAGIQGLVDDFSGTHWEILEQAADRLDAVDRKLQGVPGVTALITEAGASDAVSRSARRIQEVVTGIESDLDRPLSEAADAHDSGFAGSDLERTNAAIIRCKDALWGILRDRLRAAAGVDALVPDLSSAGGVGVVLSLHQALSAVDRLEVRGRDSAGIEVQLTGHGLSMEDPAVVEMIESRANPSFTSGSVRFHDGVLVIVYKAAAEIGELGDNTAVLRDAIARDDLLPTALN